MSVKSYVDPVDQYCNRLLKALRKMPASEREETVKEVRSHILDRIEAEPEMTDQILTEILRSVGDPKELAAEYRTHALLRHATYSRSPLVLLRATLRWGAKSVTGFVAFLAATIGYGCALVFLLSAFLKPIFPSRIGVWLAARHTICFGYWNGGVSKTELYGISVRPPVSFVLGTLGPTDGPVRELLGAWLSPVGVFCGVTCFLATSLIVRSLVRRFSQKKEWMPSLSYAKPKSVPS
jgi:uncharacterized membrane protein